MKKCFLCKSGEKDDVKYGEFLTRNDLSVHYFCLLLSSNLVQNGSDERGILGFMPHDIKKEAFRIALLVCVYCKQKSANISCCAPRCRKAFHTVCGLQNGTVSQFFGTFKSFCDRHAKSKKWNPPKTSEICCICYDELISSTTKYSPVNILKAPCCRKGWFHKWCLATLANTAGYFFKCPLCNDSNVFRTRLVYKGIFIPDRDAAWELEPNAFIELLHRPNTCSAEICHSIISRKENSLSNPLMICDGCGSISFHKNCRLTYTNESKFICNDCLPVLSNHIQNINTQLIKSISKSETGSIDDIHLCVSSDEELDSVKYKSNG